VAINAPKVGLARIGPFFGGPVRFVLPTAPVRYVISGITKDSTGAVLGSCAVTLYQTGQDAALQTKTSDAVDGSYTFNVTETIGRTFYIVAYKAGSPDVAGTTTNTLVAA